jgi:hypothetical protein
MNFIVKYRVPVTWNGVFSSYRFPRFYQDLYSLEISAEVPPPSPRRRLREALL